MIFAICEYRWKNKLVFIGGAIPNSVSRSIWNAALCELPPQRNCTQSQPFCYSILNCLFSSSFPLCLILVYLPPPLSLSLFLFLVGTAGRDRQTRSDPLPNQVLFGSVSVDSEERASGQMTVLHLLSAHSGSWQWASSRGPGSGPHLHGWPVRPAKEEVDLRQGVLIHITYLLG